MDRSDAAWLAFWDSLDWRPIGEYVPDELVLVRAGDQVSVAFHGESSADVLGEDADLTAMWRDQRDPSPEAPLAFVPIEFAQAPSDRLAALCEV